MNVTTDENDDNCRRHTVKRTVPYNPTKSKEGLMIAADGSIKYDDAWMHSDVLDEDVRNSRVKDDG